MEENNQNVKTENTESKQTAKEKPKTKTQILTAENETLKKQVEEFKDKWMRCVAEFDNYKKRNAKIYTDAFNDGRVEVLLKILPIGDTLDWALKMELDEKTMDGLKAIKKKFNETLESFGVEEIDPTGKPFDPNIAEAVMQAEKGEGEESDICKQVFQKGYKLNSKIIRYASVSVTK